MYYSEEQITQNIPFQNLEDDITSSAQPDNINYPINTDLPFYTPTEMIDNGILDEFNKGKMLSDNISLEQWFTNYWQECNGVYTSDTKKFTNAWKSRINSLYYDMKNSENKDEQRKEIYALGWNPEISFSLDNRIKARNRVTRLVNQDMCTVIDLSNMNIDDGINEDKMPEVPAFIKPIYIVLVKGKTVIGKTIRAVTHGEYSHACISLDNTMHKLYTFNLEITRKAGFTIEDSANFKDAKISVFAMLVKNDVFEKVKSNIEELEKKADDTRYNVINLFTILFNKSIKLDLNMVCSTFVDRILKLSDIDITGKDSSLVTPMDLYNGSKKNNRKKKIYKMFEDVVSKYRPEKVAKKIDKLIRSNSVMEGGIICETKAFPLEFDKEGNLLLHKSSRINFNEEFNKSHRLLLSYEKTNNISAIKYELSKLYYLNTLIEKKLSKKYDKALVDSRARILNDFNKYLIFVIKFDKKFNFIEYYNESPFSDSKIKVSASTLKWTLKLLKNTLKVG